MNTNLLTILPKEKSGKEVAKEKIGRAKPSKLTAAYWSEKVFRPVYLESGKRSSSPNFFARVQHAGRREAVGLGTSDRDQAARIAAKFFGNVRSQGWDFAVKELDPDKFAASKSNAITVGEICRAIMSASGVKERTATNYGHALRWWAARALDMKARRADFGPTGSRAYRVKAESLPLASLKTEFVRGIIARMIAEAKGDAVKERSAKISVASFLRNAKAALTLATKQGVVLPDPRPFDGVATPQGAKAPVYKGTIDAGDLLKQARAELMDTDRDAYICILLALGAGLRRGELLNLKWHHVLTKKSVIDVSAGGSWTPKTLESEALVYVDPGMIVELERFRGGLDDSVTSPVGADNAVDWLRRHGVRGDKPLHVLRKEFGSIVAQSSDLFTASKALRHSSLAVTAGFYVENRKRVAPGIGAMLAGKGGDK